MGGARLPTYARRVPGDQSSLRPRRSALRTRVRRYLALRARVRQGRVRVRSAALPIAQACVAAGVAYAIAYYWLGHTYPFFAAIVAWVTLGFEPFREVRKVAELTIGVAIGVLLGDLLVHLIGAGWWLVALVLGVSALLARFVDRGPALTMQAGVQSIVIVGLPAFVATSGPLGRWLDALVGGVVALAVVIVTPTDLRSRPRKAARAALVDLTEVLEVLARGLRTGSVEDVEESLVRGRASQPALDEWRDAVRGAADLARVSPQGRSRRPELERLRVGAVLADRAMRSARVVSRRAIGLVEHGTMLPQLAEVVAELAAGTGELAEAFGGGLDLAPARARFAEATGHLDPFALGQEDWQAQALVLVLRSFAVDLQESAGASGAEARAALPPL